MAIFVAFHDDRFRTVRKTGRRCRHERDFGMTSVNDEFGELTGCNMISRHQSGRT
jgi:hypothetical protein